MDNALMVQSNTDTEQIEENSSTIELQEKAVREQDMEVLTEVVDIMREDPAVSSMLEVVRQTPDIFIEVQPMLSRRDEFEKTALPGDLHRTFTPLFAGIASSRRGSELLSLAMSRHTEAEATALLETIRTGNTYVPEVVVGSGIHASIYNGERMAADPLVPALTIEGEETEGGQFAGPEGPVFRTNTRTRPENPDLPNVPGAAGSLNNFEGSAVLQQADITGAVFGTQDTLGKPVRVNHLLYSKILNETDVLQIERNDTSAANHTGRYLVTLRRKESGDTFTVTTDRVVFASGLGEEETGFENSDDESKRILAEEMEKAGRGEDAQIMTFAQFAKRVGDESDPFPLRPFGWVAVVGPGDSGAVAAEYLLGYGPDTRLSTAQLDRVKEVFWIGQKAHTRAELAKNIRLRYIGLAQEMPVDEKSDYAHRITPISGRAYKLERTEDGRIRIFHGVKQEDGTIYPVGDVVVDHVVLATGFKKITNEICTPIAKSGAGLVEETVKTNDGWAIAKRYKGEEIYKVGPAAELLVSDEDAKMSPAMKLGKKFNQTVAIWASSEETAAAARLLGPVKVDEERPRSLTTIDVEPKSIELPAFSSKETVVTQAKLEVDRQHLHSLLRYDAVSEDVTRLAVGTALHGYNFPNELQALELTVRRIATDEQRITFDIEVIPGLPETNEYMKMLERLGAEPMLQAVLVRLTERAVHSLQTAVLDIPFMGGKASLGEVEIRVKRR